MHHDTPLISTIVAGLVLAYLFGMLANRLRLPPLVGYLLAGVLVGPYTPGFVADQALGAELAELGVILLMFGVGLHFSLKDLMSVRALAIPGAVVQIACATLLGAGLGLLMGWDLGGSLLFGLALSVASTVVLLKALQDRRLIETEKGRIAVGWLIVEDLAMVLALVLIPAIAGLYGTDTGIHDPFVSFVERLVGTDVGIWGVLALTLVKIAAFIGFMLVVGRRLIPWALHYTAHTGSRELFRLAVLAMALGVALGSAVLFGVSLALGAFFAGMILSESELSHRAANETLPLRDAFSVLFFVSVGMLFDPMIVVTNPLPVLATVFIIIIGKSAAAFGIVMLFRRPAGTALTISASLAQIGEFSFILATLGVSLAILPQDGQDLILAGALISIILNPIVFWIVEAMRPAVEARFGTPARHADERVEPGELSNVGVGPATTDIPSEAAIDTGPFGADGDTSEPSSKTGHIVMVGYGQVGRVVAEGLKSTSEQLVIIEDSDHDVAAARAAGFEVVVGNAASPPVLRLANLEHARTLLVAISNGFEAGSVCETGRKLNPSIHILARAYSAEEEEHLRSLGADVVIRGEREIGLGLLAWLRGERQEPAAPTAALPADPEAKLPPTGNLLAQASVPTEAVTLAVPEAAAAAAVAAVTVSTATAEEPAEPVSTPEATENGGERAEGTEASEQEAPPAEPTEAAAPDIEDDPVIVVAVEGGSEPELDIDITIAEHLETTEATPAVAEAPELAEEARPEDTAAEPPADVEATPEPAAVEPAAAEPEPAPQPTEEVEAPQAGEADVAGDEQPDEDDTENQQAPVVPPVEPERR